MSESYEGINIGDVIEFPKHAESRVIEMRPASVILSQGVPGRFKVTAITERGVELEKLPDAEPVHWIDNGVNACGREGRGDVSSLATTCGDCAGIWRDWFVGSGDE